MHLVCPADLCPTFPGLEKILLPVKETQRLMRIICCQRRLVFSVLHRLPKWKLGLGAGEGLLPGFAKMR